MLQSSEDMKQIVKEILSKENIEFKYIVKASSGFTCLVYIVDDEYIIKLSKSDEVKEKICKEIDFYKNFDADFIPKLISEGEYKGCKYAIISKIAGKSLFDVWHYLTEEKREDCVRQICVILKFFHSQDKSILAQKYINENFLQDFKNSLFDKLKLLGKDGETVLNYLERKFSVFFNENRFAIIYNDAHFDNFIYNEGKVYLIDFDRVEYALVDYELMIFKTMCDYPTKFASESNESLVHDEDFINIYQYFKKYYEDMFNIEYIEDRVFIYQFDYLLEQACETSNQGWINKLLCGFRKKFSID